MVTAKQSAHRNATAERAEFMIFLLGTDPGRLSLGFVE
jgi:hypothetical protein